MHRERVGIYPNLSLTLNRPVLARPIGPDGRYLMEWWPATLRKPRDERGEVGLACGWTLDYRRAYWPS